MKKLIEIKEELGELTCTISPQGYECQFLMFLLNTSNFTWKKSSSEVTPADVQNNIYELLNKLCAIGYLFQPMKFRSRHHRAVIAHNESNNTESRNGKSLFFEVLTKVLAPSVKIKADHKYAFENNFVWADVDSTVEFILLEDLHPSIPFENLFEAITGDLTVNRKGQSKIIIPFEESPKIMVTTQNTIKGDGASFRDRMWDITFSNYYNQEHHPVHDFGNLFISEWEEDQWLLVNQLIVECQQLYLEWGYQGTSDH